MSWYRMSIFFLVFLGRNSNSPLFLLDSLNSTSICLYIVYSTVFVLLVPSTAPVAWCQLPCTLGKIGQRNCEYLLCGSQAPPDSPNWDSFHSQKLLPHKPKPRRVCTSSSPADPRQTRRVVLRSFWKGVFACANCGMSGWAFEYSKQSSEILQKAPHTQKMHQVYISVLNVASRNAWSPTWVGRQWHSAIYLCWQSEWQNPFCNEKRVVQDDFTHASLDQRI